MIIDRKILGKHVTLFYEPDDYTESTYKFFFDFFTLKKDDINKRRGVNSYSVFQACVGSGSRRLTLMIEWDF